MATESGGERPHQKTSKHRVGPVDIPETMDDTEPTSRTDESLRSTSTSAPVPPRLLPRPPMAVTAAKADGSGGDELLAKPPTVEADWDAEDSLISWKLIAVIVGVLAVVGLGAFKLFGGTKADSTSVGAPNAGVEIVDGFTGSSTDGIGTADTGQPWESVAGTWAKQDGHAFIQSPVSDAGQRSMALVDLKSPNGSVSAKAVKMTPNWALIFRYTGPYNYWLIAAAPKFGGYNIIKVVDGKSLNVASSGLAKVSDGTSVGVEFQAGSIAVVIDGTKVKTIDDSTNITGTKVGLAADVAGKDAQWGSFIAKPLNSSGPAGNPTTTGAGKKPKPGPAPKPPITSTP